MDIHEVIKLKTIDKEINNEKTFTEQQFHFSKQAKELEKNILPESLVGNLELLTSAKSQAGVFADKYKYVQQSLEFIKQHQYILQHANALAIAPPPIPLEQFETAKQALKIAKEFKKQHDAMLKQAEVFNIPPYIAKNYLTKNPKHEPAKDNNSVNGNTEYPKKQELQDVNYYQKYQLSKAKGEEQQIIIEQQENTISQLQAIIDAYEAQHKPNNLEIENQRKREVREKGRQIASKEWRNSNEKITKKAMAQIVHKKLHDDKNVDLRYIPQPDTISRNWLTNDIKPSYIKGGRPSKKPKK